MSLISRLLVLIVVIIVAVVVSVDGDAIVNGAKHGGIDHLQRFRCPQNIIFHCDTVGEDEDDAIDTAGNDLRIRESQ